MMPDPSVSVVVPTYNERDNIEPLVTRLFAAVDRSRYDLIVVDDNSPDGTAAQVARFQDSYPVRCLTRASERGLATAVIAGMKAASGELILSMDADLSHPPEAIPAIIRAMDDPDVEMVIGSRFVPGGKVDLHWPLHRRINSWAARMMARPLTSAKDMMAGFFCVRRAGLQLDRLRPVGYKIALELIVRHGWKNVVEVPITFSDRTAGQTKLTVAEQLRYLRHLARLYGFALFGPRRGPS